jgi:hypothetical protein
MGTEISGGKWRKTCNLHMPQTKGVALPSDTTIPTDSMYVRMNTHIYLQEEKKWREDEDEDG